MTDQKNISLYLTRKRAEDAGIKVLANLDHVTSFEIIPGSVKWQDGSRDNGFKVRIRDNRGMYRYL